MISMISNMATTIRAVVSDEEKENIKHRADELGITESQIIRQGLRKMGVSIEVEKPKSVQGQAGRNFYGQGGKKKADEIEQHREQIIADYEAGSTWDELTEKYPFSRATIGKIIPKGGRKRGVKAKNK